jgi:nucleoside 2-deoxyribosyltransferase
VAPNAFVAMQFGEPFDTIYREVIKPESEKLGFEVMRIDELNQPGIIVQDIQRRIEDSKVVIAEISAANQNVYYEVGYAHALNKPTILLAQRGKDLPFDIRSYRVIFYENTIGGKPLVESTLREHRHAILQDL